MAYADPAKQREAMRQWRDANREHVRSENRKRYAANREKMRQFGRDYYAKKKNWKQQVSRKRRKQAKEEIITFLGGFCSDCGITDTRVLHVHHILGDGFKDRRVVGGNKNLDVVAYYKTLLERAKTEAGALKLLCANCHLISHWKEDNDDKN